MASHAHPPLDLGTLHKERTLARVVKLCRMLDADKGRWVATWKTLLPQERELAAYRLLTAYCKMALDPASYRRRSVRGLLCALIRFETF